MKIFHKLKIWFGKKLFNLGLNVLLRIDEADWNPKKERYPNIVKQTRYVFGKWITQSGMRMELRGLNKIGWPGYSDIPNYYDKNFYIKHPYGIKERKNKRNDNDTDNSSSYYGE